MRHRAAWFPFNLAVPRPLCRPLLEIVREDSGGSRPDPQGMLGFCAWGVGQAATLSRTGVVNMSQHHTDGPEIRGVRLSLSTQYGGVARQPIRLTVPLESHLFVHCELHRQAEAAISAAQSRMQWFLDQSQHHAETIVS